MRYGSPLVTHKQKRQGALKGTADNEQEQTKEELMGAPLSEEEARFIQEKVTWAAGKLTEAHKKASKVIYGMDDVIDLALQTVAAGGSFLGEGVPGVGKTLFFSNIATILGLDFKRIQFTPDLMPA